MVGLSIMQTEPTVTDPVQAITTLAGEVVATVSLPDLMRMLPQLHLRHLESSKLVTLRQLCLVSKEMRSMVMSAVTSCTVHLGCGGASPSPQQLARRICGAKLLSLEVSITVVSGGCLI